MKLQRLLVRHTNCISAHALAKLVAQLPTLRELDLVECHMGDDGRELLDVLASRPDVTATVAACDPLRELSSCSAACVRCVTCSPGDPSTLMAHSDPSAVCATCFRHELRSTSVALWPRSEWGETCWAGQIGQSIRIGHEPA
ncbi:hypothetical protein OAO87_01660 [bacterium]|nr:hypothetical protein [bacterium]